MRLLPFAFGAEVPLSCLSFVAGGLEPSAGGGTTTVEVEIDADWTLLEDGISTETDFISNLAEVSALSRMRKA